MGDLRCLTLHQPYPLLVIRGAKGWETRSRRTNYRGPVAIHAGISVSHLPVGRTTFGDYEVERDASGFLVRGGSLAWPYRLPLGAVVAVADLTDCLPIVEEDEDLHIEQPCIEVRPTGVTNAGLWLWTRGENEDLAEDISDQLSYGHWQPGSWAWRLENVRRLPQPIPARGKQGLWRPDDELVAAIGAALPEATP